jgi:hypothetical protein
MIIPTVTSGWRRAASGAGHPITADRQPLPSVKRPYSFDWPRAVGDERRAGHGSICPPQPAGYPTNRGACVMAIPTAADSWRRATGGHGGALLSQTAICSGDVRVCDQTARTSRDETRNAVWRAAVGGRPSARSPLAVTAQPCIASTALMGTASIGTEAFFPRSPLSRVSPPDSSGSGVASIGSRGFPLAVYPRRIPPDQARRQSGDGFSPARRSPQPARPSKKNTSHGAPTKRGISTASTPSIRSRCSKILLNA